MGSKKAGTQGKPRGGKKGKETQEGLDSYTIGERPAGKKDGRCR